MPDTTPVLKQRVLGCENSKFRVYLDELHVQDRLHVRDYMTVAPKQLAAGMVAGVAVLPLLGSEEQVGLLQIHRHPIDSLSDRKSTRLNSSHT